MAIYRLRTEVLIETNDDMNAGMKTVLRVFDQAMTEAFIRQGDDPDRIVDYKHLELSHEAMGSGITYTDRAKQQNGKA